MQHVIIVGPPKTGKTSLCAILNKEYKKKVATLNDVVLWHKAEQTDLYKQASDFLDERRKEY